MGLFGFHASSFSFHLHLLVPAISICFDSTKASTLDFENRLKSIDLGGSGTFRISLNPKEFKLTFESSDVAFQDLSDGPFNPCIIPPIGGGIYGGIEFTICLLMMGKVFDRNTNASKTIITLLSSPSLTSYEVAGAIRPDPERLGDLDVGQPPHVIGHGPPVGTSMPPPEGDTNRAFDGPIITPQGDGVLVNRTLRSMYQPWPTLSPSGDQPDPETP